MRFRCDDCGQFVSMHTMIRDMVTPDSEFTKEEYETFCLPCYRPILAKIYEQFVAELS
jgi:hypothetical protein